MINITKAEFITSAASQSQFLKADKPIIAVCGKSNVGKSSFINMLANRKKLAKVSKDPGRTRLVNYFDFGEFILADLPGYGFARVSKTEKMRWAHLLDEFFMDKSNLTHAFVLADIRHDPTMEDKQMVDYLYYHLVPFTVIATKADKISRMACINSVRTVAATFKCGEQNVISTSSETKQGLVNILEKLELIVNTFAEGQGAEADEDA